MQTLTLPKSSAQEEQIIVESWRAVIDLALHCKSLNLGRGCVVYELKTDVFGFISLFDMQTAGADELEMKPEIFAQILELAGSGYDYATELLLLIKSDEKEQIRYKIEIAGLNYDSWRDIPEFADLRKNMQLDQQLVARAMLAQMKAKRTSKKKNKRRK